MSCRNEVLLRKSQVYIRFGKLVEATEILLSIEDFYVLKLSIQIDNNGEYYFDVDKWNLYIAYDIAGCEIAKKFIMSKKAETKKEIFLVF